MSKGRTTPLLVGVVALLLFGSLLVFLLVFLRSDGARRADDLARSPDTRGSTRNGSSTLEVLQRGAQGSARDAEESSTEPGLGAALPGASDVAERFAGRGTLRGHVEVDSDDPFPSAWRLVLSPSTTLAGREHAEPRVLELAGTQDFALGDLPLAGYDVAAEAEGWNPVPLPVLLERASPEVFVNLRMMRAGYVEGRVLDDAGLPAAGVTITLVAVADRSSRDTSTDELGRYRFEEVLDGAYELGVGPLRNPILRERRTVRVRAPGMTVPEFVLPRLAALQVTVVDSFDERLLQGVEVTGSGTRGGVLRAETDAWGEALVRHLPPGPWRLRLSLEGFEDRRDQVELTAGETTRVVLSLQR